MSEQRVEAIRPYDQQQAKAEQVRQMFDNIAPAYDFMNRAMTLGVDRWWRRVAVKKVAHAAPRHILDVATGTGDFALALYDHIHPEHIILVPIQKVPSNGTDATVPGISEASI